MATVVCEWKGRVNTPEGKKLLSICQMTGHRRQKCKCALFTSNPKIGVEENK